MAVIRAIQALVRGTPLASLQAAICEARWPPVKAEGVDRFPGGSPGPLTEDRTEASHI